jgi:hypothetical protein
MIKEAFKNIGLRNIVGWNIIWRRIKLIASIAIYPGGALSSDLSQCHPLQRALMPVASSPLISCPTRSPPEEAIVFATGLDDVYISMPHSDYSFLKLPCNLLDLQVIT